MNHAKIRMALQAEQIVVVRGVPGLESSNYSSCKSNETHQMHTFTVGTDTDKTTYNRVKGFLRNLNPAINPELLSTWEPKEGNPE